MAEAKHVVERAVALRLARDVLVGLEVTPADLMAVADWLLSGHVDDTVEVRAQFLRDKFNAGIVRLPLPGQGVAGD